MGRGSGQLALDGWDVLDAISWGLILHHRPFQKGRIVAYSGIFGPYSDIFEPCSNIFGHIRTYSDIFEPCSDHIRTYSDHIRTCSEHIRTYSDHIQTIFGSYFGWAVPNAHGDQTSHVECPCMCISGGPRGSHGQNGDVGPLGSATAALPLQ